MRFSIIVPVYNTEKYLQACVASILEQTFPEFELLLIDDASPDRCPEICDSFARSDARVRVIHKAHEGLVAARRTGVENSSGEYICYVDSDDRIEPQLLETVERAISKYNPDMVLFRAEQLLEDGRAGLDGFLPAGYYDKARLRAEVYPHMLYNAYRIRRGALCVSPFCWDKVFRRELLCKHLCQDAQITIAEDMVFVYECLYYANDAYACSEILYEYNRCNANSMTTLHTDVDFANSRRVLDYLRTNLGGLDGDLDTQLDFFQAQNVLHNVLLLSTSHSFLKACRTLKRVMQEMHLLDGARISREDFPLLRCAYLALLKGGCYTLCVLIAKIYARIKPIKVFFSQLRAN